LFELAKGDVRLYEHAVNGRYWQVLRHQWLRWNRQWLSHPSRLPSRPLLHFTQTTLAQQWSPAERHNLHPLTLSCVVASWKLQGTCLEWCRIELMSNIILCFCSALVC